jgi:glycolate oxidase
MLSPTLISQLRSIVGPDGVIDGAEDLLVHAGDAAEADAHTDVLVHPGTGEETAEILALAAKEGVPVVPRGSGTGPSRGSMAREGEIVLSTARMNRIRSVSAEDLIAVVEPGVRTEDFHRHVEEMGLFYPPGIAMDRPATLGGNVGESTRGLRAIKYGGTRNFLMGMKVALPTGEILQTGARTLKCVTGYDLPRLFTGSMGTLGVATELYLKLLPLPESRITTVAVFNRARDAAEAAARMLEAGVTPSILELMDRTALRAVDKKTGAPFPRDAGALLLIETDGVFGTAESQAARATSVCHDSGAGEVRRASTAHAVEEIWGARKAAFSALAEISPATVLEDVRVPRSKVGDLVGSLRALVEIEGVALAVFGHVGEGRFYTVIPVNPAIEEEIERTERIVARLSEEVCSLGGQLGPERSVGVGDRTFLDRNTPPEKLELVTRLKKAFDPKAIMNPKVRL